MEKCKSYEEAIVYVKELDMFLTMKVHENTPAVLSSLWKLCDENGCSNEWINGLNHISLKTEIRTICNTENFVPIVVPGLSRSSLAPSSTSRTPMRQKSHSSSSSSSSPSPTVGEIPVREREDETNSDISPVPVSEFVDDSSGRPDETQANKNPNNKKETTIARGDPWCSDQFWDSGMAARIEGDFGGWRNSITGRLSRQFFSWSFFRADRNETWGLG